MTTPSQVPATVAHAATTAPRSTPLSRAICGALTLTAVAGIGITQSAFALNYPVSSTLDDGSSGTLRSAIDAANANAGPDTITFASGVSGTITLNPSYGSLYISDALTITGPGASSLTIDGSSIPAPNSTTNVPASDFLVNAASSSSSALPVTISDMTITGGQGTPTNGPSQTFGGGIFATSADLTVANCVVTGNSATVGGGIAIIGYGSSSTITGSALTITGSHIDANSAYNAGGVASAVPTLTITDSSISGNVAALPAGASSVSSSSYGLAGGLLSKYGTSGSGVDTSITINRSTISGNSASNAGGGFVVAAAVYAGYTNALTVSASTISGNSAALFGGGVIESLGATASVVNSTIANNVATGATKYDGGTSTTLPALAGGLGALMVNPSAGMAASTLSFVNSTVSGNQAAYGGGLYLTTTNKYTSGPAPVFSATNTVIGGNTATTSGADILGPGVFTPPGASGPNGSTGPALQLTLDHSLLETAAAGNVAVTDNGGNIFNTAPMLGPLANNGGPTPTMLALQGSPLIDAGGTNVSGDQFDQRGSGHPRVLGNAIDIGATEYGQAPPQSIAVPGLGNGGKFTLGGLLALAGLLLTRRRRRPRARQ